MKMKEYVPSALGIALTLLLFTCLFGYLLLQGFSNTEAVEVTIEFDIAKILGVLMGGIAIPTAVVGYAMYRNKNSQG